MLDFRPPKINPVVLDFCQWALPAELWRAQVSVAVPPADLRRFQELKDKHVVVVCNHSDRYDPEVMFALAKMVGEEFHFPTAREVFDWVFGSVGWWFQSLGCYSVSRGNADLESFEMTRSLIVEGKRKLVIFPEGEITRRPDFLMPLRRGATRLFFEGQERLLESQPDTPVYILPVGIRWRYRDNITPWLGTIVTRLEARLGLIGQQGGLVHRAQGCAAAMLTIMEREYDAADNSHLEFEQRVDRLREHILASLSPLLGVERPEDGSQIVWLRRLLNAIERLQQADQRLMTPFQAKLHTARRAKLRRFVSDCRRVQKLVGVAPDKVQRPISQERLAALIGHVERQVFGIALPKGPRVAMVGIGEPVSLLDFRSQYQNDQQLAVERVTDLMSDLLQRIIDKLDDVSSVMNEVHHLPKI